MGNVVVMMSVSLDGYVEGPAWDQAGPRQHPGDGRPLFAAGGAGASLTLRETRTFGNGVVLLRHAVERGGGGQPGR